MANLDKSAQRISQTDLGNAKRLVKQFGKDIRYCHAWDQWLVWDGKRWQPDATGEIQRIAKSTALSIYGELTKAKIRTSAKNSLVGPIRANPSGLSMP